MNLKHKINILSQLGKIMRNLGADETWSGYELGINESEYEDFRTLIENVHIYNGWFTKESVQHAFFGISDWLTEENLENWTNQYKIKDPESKTVAIIMAGNLPLVGFHDFISVFLSGNKALIKLSSDDQKLFPAILKTLSLFDEEINNYIKIADGPLSEFEAVIATGSDNSSNYFKSYFGKYPHIIRKNRTSIAVLTGEESEEELKELGKDVFTFYGLGCRNVSYLLIPADFDIDRFYKGVYDYNPIIHHNKYANNYDYNKAVYLMNQDDLLDNGFLLLKEDAELHSPLGMLFYKRYSAKSEVDQFINLNKEKIQTVIGKEYIPFGQAQNPALDDYADGVDTLKFLTEL